MTTHCLWLGQGAPRQNGLPPTLLPDPCSTLREPREEV